MFKICGPQITFSWLLVCLCMTWSTYHLLQNDIILLLYCQVDSALMKIFEKCSRILKDLLQDLWSSSWACQRSMKNLWRSSSGPYWSSWRPCHRSKKILEDLLQDLWSSWQSCQRSMKILEDLLQDLWSSWRSCHRSMKNPQRSSSEPLKLLRILSKIYE